MHAAHHVTYTGDQNQQHYALVLEGDPKESGTLKLVVWEGVNGWNEHGDVPHGSTTQGDTWH
jgi:hypothetical protein